MTPNNAKRLWYLLTIVAAIGVWLMGTFNLVIHIGPYELGRSIGLGEPETYSSLFGWVLVFGAGTTMLVLIYRDYRNRK